MTKICSRCVMDENVPQIEFDDNGICNYCYQFDALDRDFPNDEQGQKILEGFVEKIKQKSKGRKYDVIIGVSGGTDSTYLVHLCKELGLRPLAVHLDNGWNSEISVNNIKKILEKLDVDLITYVIQYDEIKDILLSYMKASLPWADAPTDIAIMSALYKIAKQQNVKYIFAGNNFRTEGKQPDAWTHSDGRQLKYIQKKFGSQKIKTFPNITISNLIYYGFIKGIKMLRPFYYIDYHKEKTKKMLIEKYEWQDYGGHHHESIFTRFTIAYWLPKKFGIDKRKVTFSALIRSGQMKREDALSLLKQPPYDEKRMEEDKEYIIKKLNITKDTFTKLFEQPNKSFQDYPSYYPLYSKMKGLINFTFKYILPFKPLMSYEFKKSKKDS